MKIIKLSETDSTNRYLLDEASAFASEDITVAIADYQSAGRGMGSNTWESETGKNLLFSILVHPVWVPVNTQYLLSMTEALALRDAIADIIASSGLDAVDVTIKWPNDIYWKNKKISGTRIDGNIKGGKLTDLIIGTGINVNQREFHSDAPNPVSLWQITGKEYDRDEILSNILEYFKCYLEKARDEWDSMQKCDYIMKKYHRHLYRRNGIYRYEDKDGEFDAELVSVHPNGIMTLRKTDGSLSKYEFKEVKFINK